MAKRGTDVAMEEFTLAHEGFEVLAPSGNDTIFGGLSDDSDEIEILSGLMDGNGNDTINADEPSEPVLEVLFDLPGDTGNDTINADEPQEPKLEILFDLDAETGNDTINADETEDDPMLEIFFGVKDNTGNDTINAIERADTIEDEIGMTLTSEYVFDELGGTDRIDFGKAREAIGDWGMTPTVDLSYEVAEIDMSAPVLDPDFLG